MLFAPVLVTALFVLSIKLDLLDCTVCFFLVVLFVFLFCEVVDLNERELSPKPFDFVCFAPKLSEVEPTD